ncbi:MAG TPA: FHA domain-containing protein [Planctomycetaceae bacterium]|nr:FHA domain-containing protein [Planctomycetaceae bacterium]
MPGEPIRIDRRDLYSPQVEDYLEVQQSLRRDLGEIEPRPLIVRVLFSSWFYLAIASGLGAFVAWAVMEPYFSDDPFLGNENLVVRILFFPTVTGFVGLFLGAAEGLMCRNLGRAAVCGSVGLGIGFGAGLVALIPTMMLFQLMARLAIHWSRDPVNLENVVPTGVGFLLLIMGRGMAWAVASIPAGLGQGIALKDKKVVLNGLVGAVLGGLLGGILFDPIYALLSTDRLEADLSRAVGFTVIGLLVGLFVGLVEGWTKTAWLLMQKGPLAGKQFVIYRDTTVLGSSPRADIYLFKDDAIEPRHALLHNRGGRFEIEDLDTPDGTYVNGVPVHRQLLHHGDQIILGKTVLEFSIRERG